MRFHRLRDREVAGDGGDRPNEVSGSGSGVAAEEEDRDEESDGAVGSERAEATSVRQMWMRSCFAGGMRGLFLMTGGGGLVAGEPAMVCFRICEPVVCLVGIIVWDGSTSLLMIFYGAFTRRL